MSFFPRSSTQTSETVFPNLVLQGAGREQMVWTVCGSPCTGLGSNTKDRKTSIMFCHCRRQLISHLENLQPLCNTYAIIMSTEFNETYWYCPLGFSFCFLSPEYTRVHYITASSRSISFLPHFVPLYIGYHQHECHSSALWVSCCPCNMRGCISRD